MIEKEIHSKFLNETMTLKIYQPESFSPLQKYNICIMQDGEDYYQVGRLATVSDHLHENFEIESTIFVGIHYIDRFDRRKKYHPAGEQNEAYIKFLAHEVVSFIDEFLPSLHMGQTRTLMGDSLAGTLALMTAWKYPNTFGNVIMQSPLVDEKVLRTVKNSTKDHEALTIYHTIGTEETDVPVTDGSIIDFITPNRKLHEVLKRKNLTYHYKEMEDGQHTWKYWQQDLPHALRTMFQ
ncbi:MAG TPA: alpha/beta hydrolase-fold protein [Bacillota bacterium]